jgi:hypothetical protein
MNAARWLLAYHPDAPKALLRLKVDTVLWQERSQDGTWSMFSGQPATILDVSGQMPRILEALAAVAPPNPGRSADILLAFRLADQELVVGEGPIAVDTHTDFRTALASWRAGRAFVGCRR